MGSIQTTNENCSRTFCFINNNFYSNACLDIISLCLKEFSDQIFLQKFNILKYLQISEHCPKYKPGRWPINFTWFNRPGTASALTPREGTVQEWRTSAEEINMGTCV